MFGNKSLNIVYVISLLDLFGVGLTVPQISPYLRSIGASRTTIGFFQTSYSLLQIVWGPFFGSLSDSKGRKLVLFQTTLLCTVAYFLLGLSSSLFLFFLVRVAIGTLKHIQSLCKAVIADAVPESKHVEALGHSTALSTLGFVIGPLLGGFISEQANGFFLVCLLTAVVFLFNAGLVLCLPASKVREKAHRENSGSSEYNKIKNDMLQAFTNIRDISWRDYWDAFLLRLLFGLSTSIYFSNQTLYMQEKYNLPQRYVGITISFFSMVSVFSAFLLGFISKILYKDDNLCNKRLLHGYLVMTMCLFGLYAAPNYISFLAILIPYSISTTVLRIVSMELLLNRSTKDDKKGCLSGLSNSVMSAARLVTPVTSGLLGDMYGEDIVILSAIIPAFAGTVLSFVFRSKTIKTKES